MSAADIPAFLPFTRPTVDEETITEVSAVMRSGWLTRNGPKVQAFEAALTDYFGGRPVPSFDSGTCTMEIGFAGSRSLRVIEDAAQAIGSTWQGKRIGAFGGMVSCSFPVNKNIMTAEGGCLVLNTAEEAQLAEGFNARRRALAEHYFRCFGAELESRGAELPIADFTHGNRHLFHIVLPDRITRAEFMQRMLDRKIGLGFHYAAIHLFTLYRQRGFRAGMFPVAERVCRQIVTLPLFPTMTNADVERVVEAVLAILGA
jgi:dTDP-4-amino-4,6-dideoxygalactose transaminase